MSNFILKAACRGRRPSQFSGYNGYQRAVLMGRLLKEREVARFVVAPDGYGKTSLVVDYAETVFSWANVFFVNGQSPCFLRDLDEGALASLILEVDDQARLVVFDDLPMLDTGRAALLSRAVDSLIAKKCEVILTCTPMCDVFSGLQRDRVYLSARDLLLTDEEVEAAHGAGDWPRTPSDSLPAANRVPALAWGQGQDAVEMFVKQLFKEQMPADLLLAIACMLVLHAGNARMLEAICPIDVAEAGDLLDFYPHLGYNADTGDFEAPALPVERLASAMKKNANLLVSSARCSTWEKLSLAWADALFGEGSDPARACDVLRCLCPRPCRSDWLLSHARYLVGRGCFYPTLKAVGSLGSAKPGDASAKARLASLEVVCRQVLGDEEGAVRCAKRFAFNADIPLDSSIFCLLAVVRYGTASQRNRAADFLKGVADGMDESELGSCSEGELLALLWHESQKGSRVLAERWTMCHMLGVGDFVLCLAASWYFAIVGAELAEALPLVELPVSCELVERFVRERIERDRAGGLDFFSASAGLSMERAHMKGMMYCCGMLSAGLLLDLRKVELSVLAQRRQLECDLEEERTKANSWVETHPDSATTPPAALLGSYAQRNVPVLSLRFFGTFEVAIGGVPIDAKHFRRQNVRSLLVLLAVNQGRELSRDSMAHAMWPDSSEKVARKSFYSIWSQLKLALSLSDGTCPYLIRHQYGCSLEVRHVQSDIARFNEICRELQFGRPGSIDWVGLYAEIERDFSCELMPSEKKNPLVLEARNECRARLVDALVSASASVVEEGNPKWGIWFARAAVEREKAREDAYVALMKAQVASQQRTAAIMTYLKCRRVLAEELGVDPSPETQALYQQLIETI